MITYDPSEPGVLRVDAAHTDEVLRALAADESFDGSDQMPSELRGYLREVLTQQRGEIGMVVSGPDLHLVHLFALAQNGLLRRTRLSAARDELALSPTPVLPGILLRLAGLAPVDPLPADIRESVAAEALESVTAPDPEVRRQGWKALEPIAARLPAPADPELDNAPPRSILLSRPSAKGDRTVQVLMLRGRYLLVHGGGLGTSLVGTDPTGASRALFSLLNPVR